MKDVLMLIECWSHMHSGPNEPLRARPNAVDALRFIYILRVSREVASLFTTSLFYAG